MDQRQKMAAPRRRRIWAFLTAGASALLALGGCSAKKPLGPAKAEVPPAPAKAELQAPDPQPPTLDRVLTKITDPAMMLEVGRDWSAAPIGSVSSFVTKSVNTLRDARAPFVDKLRAWQGLAMIFGDSGAPECCAIVSLSAIGQALSSQATGDEVPGLLSSLHLHTNLALLDLKLVHHPDTEDPHTPDLKEFARWVRTDFASLERLDDHAQLCLRFAAIRAGVLARPEPFTLEAVRALAL